MAVYIAKIKHVDLKNNGTGNPGTSNAILLMGKKVGVIVGIHDIGKGFLAVLIATLCFADLLYAPIIAGVASIMGHMFPFWMKFKGGKGFATYIGVSVALDWKMGVIILVVALILALISDYIVVATMIVIICNPIANLLFNNIVNGLLLFIPTIIIIYLHRTNLKAIANGTERKIRKGLNGGYKSEND